MRIHGCEALGGRWRESVGKTKKWMTALVTERDTQILERLAVSGLPTCDHDGPFTDLLGWGEVVHNDLPLPVFDAEWATLEPKVMAFLEHRLA